MVITQVSAAVKSVFNTGVKITGALLLLPKYIFSRFLYFTVNCAAIPLYMILHGLKLIVPYKIDSDNMALFSEAKNEDVVEGVKIIRKWFATGIFKTKANSSNEEYDGKTSEAKANSSNEEYDGKTANLSITEFTGSDLLWDLPIIAQKSKLYAQCVIEGDRKMAAATEELEQHSTYNQMLKTIMECEQPQKPKSILVKTALIENSADTFRLLSFQEVKERLKLTEKALAANNISINTKDYTSLPKTKKVQFRVAECESSGKQEANATSCSHDAHLRRQNELLRRRNIVITRKMLEIVELFNDLAAQLAVLNRKLDNLVHLNDKITNLEFQLGESKKMLLQAEVDRDEMKWKLNELTKMIEEEEKFLDDVSCESGFDELNSDSNDEL